MKKSLIGALALGLLAQAVAGEKSPVERLKADSAEVEAAAAKELVAGGEKQLKEIEAAFKALKSDQDKFRERYRDVVARIRIAKIRTSVLKLAPGLEKKFKWDGLVRYLTCTTNLPTRTDARCAFCLILRSTEDLDEAEGIRVLSEYYKDRNTAVRRAAVSALDREGWKDAATALLVKALGDKNELIRIEAGGYLVARKDQRGLAAVLTGALSKRADTRAACLDTVNSLIVTDEKGQRPQFKHTEAEVKVLISLLALEPWNTRGTVIRLLGMIGNKAAAEPLMTMLDKESHFKNRRRIVASLTMLRHRPAAARIGTVFGEKLHVTKRNYNWGAAASWGEIGDPESVPAMIALLDGDWKQQGRYAAAALSYAFCGVAKMGEPPLRGTPGQLMVPNANGRFESKPDKEAPSGAELKKSWTAFWEKNKARYKFSPEGYGLLTPAK